MQVLETDILVVGAGLLGSSVAMHLAKQGARSVVVVDVDLDGIYSSSELNAGGVRATWNSPVNAAVSRLSIDYFSTVKEEIGFRQFGYFWMYSAEAWPQASATLRANSDLRDMGIEYLSPSEVTARHPFLDKTEDLGGATFSPRDGLLNANLLKMHYRRIARESGTEFVNRVWVHRVQVEGDERVVVDAWKMSDQLSDDQLKKVLTEGTTDGAEPIRFKARTLVNCSGPWARRFAAAMGLESYSKPVRRQVSVFDCKDVDLTPFGMFVDASGVYFHSEANNVIGGYATPEEPEGYNFDYQGDAFFEEYIWPALYNRSTKFESLKHITGWAGLYEVSPDKNGIVGRVPGFKNIFEAHSFSGRGAMQSYGAGLALAELILFEGYKTIDLGVLGAERFARGKLIEERLVI